MAKLKPDNPRPRMTSEALWVGTEEALSDYLEILRKAEALPPEIGAFAQPGQAEQEIPYLFELQGSVGVINVHGPLTNRESSYNKYFGIASYGAIREALIHAAQSPEVKHILLDVNSGGGSVAGVSDTANLIRMVNDHIKPVTAFTDGTMASAAYWLGSSAGKVYSSKTAMVGSIGVIATHMEQSKALKEAGIGVTVMRAGKYKALANGVEPLTDAAKAQMQEHLDAAYQVFVQHVAEARNVSYDVADSQMAQGREFMGAAAVGAGLVDGIASYDEIFNAVSKEFIDPSINLIDNTKKSSQQEHGMKKALTEADIAAAAEGADALAASAQTEADNAASAVAEAAAAGGAAAAEGAAAHAGTAAAATGEAAAPEAGAVVDYLKAQLKEKGDDLLAAQVELAGVKKDLGDMQAAHAGLLEIAGKSISNMQVALGGAAASVEGMSAVQVLAEHKRVSAMFSDKFKAGGVAATDVTDQKQSGAAVSSLTLARLNAARSPVSK